MMITEEQQWNRSVEGVQGPKVGFLRRPAFQTQLSVKSNKTKQEARELDTRCSNLKLYLATVTMPIAWLASEGRDGVVCAGAGGAGGGNLAPGPR